MLDAAKKWQWCLAWLCLGVFLCWLLSLTHSFGTSCPHKPQDQSSQQKSADENSNYCRSLYESPIGRFVVWIGQEITHDQSPVVAIGTIALAGVTLALAVFTAFLWASTRNLVRKTIEISQREAIFSRKLERAYLGGGGECQRDDPPKPPIRKNAANQRLFRVEVGNAGKTPAFLTAFDVQFCTWDEAKKELRPVTPFPHKDQFPPGERHRHIGELRPIERDCYDIVYGAFWYNDIWGEPHCYRFIHRIAEDGHTYSDVTDVDARYSDPEWEEGIEQKDAQDGG